MVFIFTRNGVYFIPVSTVETVTQQDGQTIALLLQQDYSCTSREETVNPNGFEIIEDMLSDLFLSKCSPFKENSLSPANDEANKNMQYNHSFTETFKKWYALQFELENTAIDNILEGKYEQYTVSNNSFQENLITTLHPSSRVNTDDNNETEFVKAINDCLAILKEDENSQKGTDTANEPSCPKENQTDINRTLAAMIYFLYLTNKISFVVSDG
jgi:hypothetical protein